MQSVRPSLHPSSLKAGILLLAGILLPVVMVAARDSPPDDDEAAVRAVVEQYFHGIIAYDEEALRKAFHPDAAVIGLNKEGETESVPFDDWVVYTRGPAPDATGRNNTIVSVDITGTAAVVKTDLNWPRVRYIDYLSLMKSNGEWRIVNKIFHRGAPGETP